MTMGGASGSLRLVSLVGTMAALTLGGSSARAQQSGGAPQPGGLHHFSHVAPMRVTNVPDPVNVQHLAVLRARVPRKCGAQEVAPNVWVRVDCQTYAPIPNVKTLILTNARIHMMRSGRMKLDPNHSSLKAAPPAGGDRAGGPGAGSGDRVGGNDDVFPESVDHRQNGTEGPVKNQEYTSMCTGFSLSSTMDNAILRLGGSDVTSPTHVWAHYGAPHMASAATGNMNRPIAMWATWPFSPREGCKLSRFDDDCADHYSVRTDTGDGDPKIQSELKAADATGKYKITSIEKLALPANPDEVAAVLATGADLWVAFSLDINHWGFRTLQNNANQITDWSEPEGGHAVMLAGYRTKADGSKQFLIHNSWGTDWGDGGYAWVSDKMVRKFMHAAYKIKVEPIGGAPAQLTDDDCDMDELVDSVTGQCAPSCDDDSRPANGNCAGTNAKGPGGAPVQSKPPAGGACPAGDALVHGTCRRVHVFSAHTR